MYGGPIYLLYKKENKSDNEKLGLIVWIILFPLLLKTLSHDCILSDDSNLIGDNNSEDENISDEEWELALHQHGGLIWIVSMIIVALFIILFKEYKNTM